MTECEKVKNTLRQKYVKIRDAIEESEREAQNEIIMRRLTTMSEYVDAETVCVYASLASEVDTDRLIEKMLSDRKKVALPICNKKNRTMKMCLIKNISELLPGAYGIREPAEECAEIGKNEIDLIVVPGLCFDLSGNRIGYGGGYYDRYLADFGGTSVGIAYNECIVAEIPSDKYDCRVNMVISAKEE